MSLNCKTNNANFVMYSAVPKEKVMHILESKIHIPGIQLCACLIHLLTRKFENTIFFKGKRRVASCGGPSHGVCCLPDIQ